MSFRVSSMDACCLDVAELIHSPSEGHVYCFHVLAIMNKASTDIRGQACVWTCFQLLRIRLKRSAVPACSHRSLFLVLVS